MNTRKRRKTTAKRGRKVGVREKKEKIKRK